MDSKKVRYLAIFVAIGVSIWLITNGLSNDSASVEIDENPIETGFMDEASFRPIQPAPELDKRKVTLGKRLFFEPRLSKNNSVSCASCHDISKSGADGRKFSVGINGKLGVINAPTVFNSSLNFVQFWDGRAASLDEQVEGPIHDPLEMGSSWAELVSKLQADETYSRAFFEIYGEQINKSNISNAIASFEQTLVTPNSLFDRYLKGETGVLSEQQLAGFEKFNSMGCVACHQGQNFGGNMFQVFGVAKNYFEDRGGMLPSDLGRFNVTGLERDRHVFRVPSLRNVELTAPYFHDGAATTLEDAIRIMGKYQLGKKLSDEDVSDLSSFLKTLTGELPETARPERKAANVE